MNEYDVQVDEKGWDYVLETLGFDVNDEGFISRDGEPVNDIEGKPLERSELGYIGAVYGRDAVYFVRDEYDQRVEYVNYEVDKGTDNVNGALAQRVGNYSYEI